MASQLHARKKLPHAAADEEAAPLLSTEGGRDESSSSPPKSGGGGGNNKFLRRLRRGGSLRGLLTRKDVSILEWECALVSFFVVIALLLAYLLLHHRHRRVIYHVMKHPWDHGRAVFRQPHGKHFRHHFYSGAPRFVTVVLPSVVNPDGRPRRLESIQGAFRPGEREKSTYNLDSRELLLWTLSLIHFSPLSYFAQKRGVPTQEPSLSSTIRASSPPLVN
jgi:hypothetical protein